MFALNILPRTLNWRTQNAGHRRLRRVMATCRNPPWPSVASESLDVLPWTQLPDVLCLQRVSQRALSANLRCDTSAGSQVDRVHTSRYAPLLAEVIDGNGFCSAARDGGPAGG